MLYRKTVAPETFRLLETISSIADLSEFSLKGGTALALQMGHRISVDLDFFGNKEFSPDEIVDLLQDLKPLTMISQRKNILILNVQNVKVDFVNYRYPLIADLIREGSIRLHAPEDIAAMMLAAIAGRGRKRDFYDIHFLFSLFTLRQMMDYYNRKFEDGSEMMVARSLTFFEDADLDEMPNLVGELVPWPNVRHRILQEVRSLY
jgi:predicted nucleotidyltransferase component of viral defense system